PTEIHTAALRDALPISRGIGQLAARLRLALVVVEEHAGASVELRNDDALRPVDDERTGLRHQRDFAEVDLLLLDVAHDALAALRSEEHTSELQSRENLV